MRILLGRVPEFLGVVALAVLVATCGSVSVKNEDGGAGAGGKDASPSGSAGATGASGAIGSAGATGSAGAAATAGATGSAGDVGSAGATGAAGATGSAGSGPRDGGSADATGTAGAGGHGGGGTSGAGGAGGAGGGAGGAGGGGSGGSSGTCLRGKGCCANDNDCITADECVGGTCSATVTSAGVCEPKPTGNGCWSDADCSLLSPTCKGATVCPCGVMCFAPDKMGTCQLILETPL